MIIGAKIAACRKRAGMSQEKLANELNISRQAFPAGKRVKPCRIPKRLFS